MAWICKCGEVAACERRKAGRRGYAERVACQACGAATPWEHGGSNGEHRPELARKWALLDGRLETIGERAPRGDAT